jgi:16S rRNA (guanine966-N2)-methyltransferase
MRITGGQYKNRKLFVPEGNDVRPTSDRMRQSLFNMMKHSSWAADFDIDDARVLDIFCGTGALGIEALSHGAKHCLFIDTDIHAVQRNTAFLDNEHYRIVKANALRFGQGAADINLVFIDPPYGQDLVEPAIQNLIEQNWLCHGAFIMIETERGAHLDLSLEKLDHRIQSKSELHIFRYNTAIK